MCLFNTKPISKKKGKGYKVFGRNSAGYLLGDYSRTFRPINQWLHEKDYRPLSIGLMGSLTYRPGFHIFIRKKDAIYWASFFTYSVVRKVKYRNAFVGGEFSGKECVVATEIKIKKKDIKR